MTISPPMSAVHRPHLNSSAILDHFQSYRSNYLKQFNSMVILWPKEKLKSTEVQNLLKKSYTRIVMNNTFSLMSVSGHKKHRNQCFSWLTLHAYSSLTGNLFNGLLTNPTYQMTDFTFKDIPNPPKYE